MERLEILQQQLEREEGQVQVLQAQVGVEILKRKYTEWNGME